MLVSNVPLLLRDTHHTDDVVLGCLLKGVQRYTLESQFGIDSVGDFPHEPSEGELVHVKFRLVREQELSSAR
jgi:hypothetical protein